MITKLSLGRSRAICWLMTVRSIIPIKHTCNGNILKLVARSYASSCAFCIAVKSFLFCATSFFDALCNSSATCFSVADCSRFVRLFLWNEDGAMPSSDRLCCFGGASGLLLVWNVAQRSSDMALCWPWIYPTISSLRDGLWSAYQSASIVNNARCLNPRSCFTLDYNIFFTKC